MSGIGAIGSALEQAQRIVEDGPGALGKFEELLSQLEQNPSAANEAQKAASAASVGGPEAANPDTRVEQIRTDALKVAESPGGIRQLGAELEGGYARLGELVGELKSGRTFTPHELVGIQGEMHDITMRIEITTKVVSEVTSGLKTLMQQQV